MKNPEYVVLRVLNRLVDRFVFLFAFLLILYSSYCLWDNSQIYAQVDSLQNAVMSLKPQIVLDSAGTSEPPAGPASGADSFTQLRAINPDICAWLTISNTAIDFPVVQGEDNSRYLNTDIYGDFATAGSVFLDYRCDREFRDEYSLVYAHHMGKGKMFGDLDLFYDAAFFEENGSGALITPNETYTLQIAAIATIPASAPVIYMPMASANDGKAVVEYMKDNAKHIDLATIQDYMEDPKSYKILCLTTCSSQFTDARTVALALLS